MATWPFLGLSDRATRDFLKIDRATRDFLKFDRATMPFSYNRHATWGPPIHPQVFSPFSIIICSCSFIRKIKTDRNFPFLYETMTNRIKLKLWSDHLRYIPSVYVCMRIRANPVKFLTHIYEPLVLFALFGSSME